jgi:hypothetical protein
MRCVSNGGARSLLARLLDGDSHDPCAVSARAKLDIKLVVERRDAETLAAIASLRLPEASSRLEGSQFHLSEKLKLC